MSRQLSQVIPKCAWPAVVLCATMNAFVFANILANNEGYLNDYRRSNNPDALHYVELGRNILEKGCYSRCSEPPYVPDMLRTPVYPLFAGAADILGGAAAIYVTQAFLQIACCLLLFHLVRGHFGEKAALAASIFLATDFGVSVSNFEAMSEPLYVFLTLSAVVCLAPAILQSGPASLMRVGTGGIILALATLTRPVGLYISFLLAAALLFTQLRQWRIWRALAEPALLAFVFALPVGAWIVRNSVVFSVNHLTTADAIMLVYFTGGGAYQIEHGIPQAEAQDMIAREFDLPPPNVTNNHWVTDISVAEMDSRLRGAQWSLLAKYPRALAVSSVLALIKSGVSHDIGRFAALSASIWMRPTTAGLLSGNSDAYRRLFQNGSLLIAAFLWQLSHLVAIYLLSGIGVAAAWRESSFRPFMLFLLLVLAYFSLTVAVVGPEAYSRSRLPHMPFLCAFGGLGLCTTCNWLGKRKVLALA
jgi:4-amino-4-deoxy-L-arabinose transferase-like glycosyltransferase